MQATKVHFTDRDWETLRRVADTLDVSVGEVVAMITRRGLPMLQYELANPNKPKLRVVGADD